MQTHPHIHECDEQKQETAELIKNCDCNLEVPGAPGAVSPQDPIRALPMTLWASTPAGV